MKKILVIEVDRELTKEHRLINNFMDEFEAEYTVITNAGSNLDQIKEILPTVDGLAFETNFIQTSAYMVKPMFKLLSKISKPLDIYIGYDKKQLLWRLETIISDNKHVEYPYHFVNDPVNVVDQTFHSIRHHNLFTIDTYISELEDIISPVDISKYVDAYQTRIDIEIEYQQTRKDEVTGKKVKINNLSTLYNKIADTLVEGSIVDVIDCEKIDPNPQRGVWVWGDGEPIKLVNDPPYNEFSHIEIDDDSVIESIINSSDLCHIELTDNDIFTIRGILYEESNHENLICEAFEIPKRGNRAKIRQIISQWKESLQSA